LNAGAILTESGDGREEVRDYDAAEGFEGEEGEMTVLSPNLPTP